MWGWPLEFWDRIAYWTLVMGSTFAGVGIVLTGFSSFVSMATSTIVQKAADDRIAVARARSDEAHSQAEQARAEQEKIRQENLNLSISLERERVERLKLEGKLASRHLSADQRAAIVATLKAVSGGKPISLTKLGDKEAGDYAEEIGSALAEGGAFISASFSGVISPPRYGLTITPREDTFLSRALDAAKVEYQRAGSPSPLPSILVGLKPPAL
jgi:hypothetical protein